MPSLRVRLSLLLLAALAVCPTGLAQGQSLPKPLTGQINDDFGPRVLDLGSGPEVGIHYGIDYDGEFGDVIVALESGAIWSVDFKGGWFIRVHGERTRTELSYIHLFEGKSAPISPKPGLIATQVLRGSREASFITLEYVAVPGAGSCYAVIFWQAPSTILKGLCEESGLNLSRPTATCASPSACKTRNRIVAGEELAAVGKSGTVTGPHLHLQATTGRVNPLFYVERDTTSPSINVLPVNALGRFLQGVDVSPAPLIASVDSTHGLDLNRVELYVYPSGASSKGTPIADFLYGGSPADGPGKNPTDGGFSANMSSYSASETILGVNPLKVGEDRFVAPWNWSSLSPGTYVVEARAHNLAGVVTTSTSTVEIVSSAPPTAPPPSIEQIGPSLSTGALTPTRLAISPSGQFLFAQLGSSIGVYNIGADGSLSSAGAPFPMPASSLRMAVDPLGRFLFVTNTTTDAISVFSIQPSGALVEVSGSPFLTGPNPQALAVSRDGQRVFAGNFGDAATPYYSISVFDVGASGTLTEVSGSPFATQFATPRGIYIAAHPTLPFLIVTGDDTSNPRRAISVYSISASGALSPVAGAPFLSGAMNGGTQNVVVSSDGALVFVVNAADLVPTPGQTCTLAVPCLLDTVSVMKLSASGTLTHISGSPFPVPSMDVGNLTDLAINPAGTLVFTQYLYGSFPTFETTVAVHQMTTQGALAPFPGSPISGGITRARGLAVSPAGNFLYVADSASRTIGAFRIIGGPVSTPPSPTLSLFTTLAPGQTFGTGPYEVDGNAQFQAFRFTPTATGDLEQITVALGRDLAGQTSTVFNLYQDAGGSRGALIESFTVTNSVPPDITFPFTGLPVTFVSSLKPRLTSGVAYWLEVSEPEVANGSFSFWFQNSLGMNGLRVTNSLPASTNVLPAFRAEGR